MSLHMGALAEQIGRIGEYDMIIVDEACAPLLISRNHKRLTSLGRKLAEATKHGNVMLNLPSDNLGAAVVSLFNQYLKEDK